MFQGVLFDLDGVICDTAEFHFQAWRALGAEIGVDIDRQFNENLKGVSRTDSLKLILEHGGMLEDFNEGEFCELANKKNDNYKEMIKQVSPDDVFPGIRSLIDELRNAGIKVSLASASKNGPILLKRLELFDSFDAIANPALVKAGKPAPDIFEKAAEEVGLNACECIGIEDSKAGIQAIKASGALPVGVGCACDLGNDICLVDTTAKLSLSYLEKCWTARR